MTYIQNRQKGMLGSAMQCVFHLKRPHPFLSVSPGCQFNVSEDSLINVDDHSWCPYHCPMTDKDNNPTEKATWNHEKLREFDDLVKRFIRIAVKQNQINMDFTGVVFPSDINFNINWGKIAVCFVKTTFHGEAWFEDTRIHQPVSFKDSTFNGPTSFKKAVFGGNVWFDKSNFKGDTWFHKTIFGQNVSLKDSNFFESARFDGAQFGQKALFNGAIFWKEANFGLATFEAESLFEHAIFRGDVSFQDATFRKANFLKATFHRYAAFPGSIFEEYSSFLNANFNQDADFRKATFLNYTNFSFTKFNQLGCGMNLTRIQGASFDHAIFKGKANFLNSFFNHDASFEETTFMGLANFKDAIFIRKAAFPSSGDDSNEEKLKINFFSDVDFMNATFGDDVSFINRQFLKPVNFTGCGFEKAPKFHGCTLHQGSVFPPRSYFRDVSEEATQAYRTLKLAMEQVRGRQEEAMFYALEQQCRRKDDKTAWSVKLLSYLYELTADYGESFLRPLWWLIAINFAAFLGYIYIASIPTGTSFSHMRECAEFTIEQLVRPFSAWIPSGGLSLKDHFGSNPVIVFLFQLVAAFQSLFNLSLITLIIIAVRRKFKLS